MKYINYDSTGNILGFYDKDIHSIIPEPFIEVEEEQWQEIIQDTNSYCIIDGAVKVKVITFDLMKYKKDKISELSMNCNTKRKEILDDTKILNILSGATLGYPDYLTPANVSKMIELFKDIYHTYSGKINTAESKDEVDVVMSEIVYPDAQYIVRAITI